MGTQRAILTSLDACGSGTKIWSTLKNKSVLLITFIYISAFGGAEFLACRLKCREEYDKIGVKLSWQNAV